MKLLTVVGARPQFIKSHPVSHALARAGISEFLLHTGQHYDERMSGCFFEELGLRLPDLNLGVGSGSHGVQTGLMLQGIEKALLEQKPDWLLVYGDTNSTLAAALAASKLQIPVAHVEAGLRSFNRRMPEEINRVLTDQLSTLLFCPSQTAVDHLAREGITKGVHLVGDVMTDALASFLEPASLRSRSLDALGVRPGAYYLCTLHRAENTDDLALLHALLACLASLPLPVLMPLHPRTKGFLERNGGLPPHKNLKFCEPLGYLDMIHASRNARAILTDSGGLQKEAYWLRVPCVTLREETEWVETLEHGWNQLTGVDGARIVQALRTPPAPLHPELYGDGRAAERIATLLRHSVHPPSTTPSP